MDSRTVHSWRRVGLAAALSALACAGAMAAGTGRIDKAEYRSAKDQIAQVYKADKESCRSLAHNARDVCLKDAEGRAKIGLADLEFAFTGKDDDRDRIPVIRAEAAYAVAKEKCDDLAGHPKDVCLQAARAQRTRHLADAKVGRLVGAANAEADKATLQADYDLAAQRCDALAGDAKSRCIQEAKSRFARR